MSTEGKSRVVTTYRLSEMKARGEKIAMLTAYDYSTARILDAAGIDVILVGDSAANVMAGHTTTVPMTLDNMIYHAQSVVRGVQRALVVVDLPFGAYQGNSKQALASAIRIMKETEAHAVKLEGGAEILESVERILSAGIPVMGHLGLTPQSINKFGTYAVRAREQGEATKLESDARLLEKAGCFGVVLEKIPASLGRKVSSALRIPVIGIGAGRGVDGQVLVVHDMLGINNEFSPRFLRRYADLYTTMTGAFRHYIADVKNLNFPNDGEQYLDTAAPEKKTRRRKVSAEAAEEQYPDTAAPEKKTRRRKVSAEAAEVEGETPKTTAGRKPARKKRKPAKRKKSSSVRLHDEMIRILAETAVPMNYRELADRINEAGRYLRPDQQPVTADQVSLRSNARLYRTMFIHEKRGTITLAAVPEKAVTKARTKAKANIKAKTAESVGDLIQEPVEA